MTAAKKLEPISVADYLEGELVSPIKHEYFGGVVYAMAGGRVLHHLIATNITTAIGSRLRGKRCQAFNSDMKVRVPPPPRERFYYPDASIVCRSNPPEDSYQDEPVVIFEVLSKATQRIDKGEKLDAYLSLPSLAVYALVEQEAALVTVYRRKGNEFVDERYDGCYAIIPLPEVDIELPLAEIYERVEFRPEVE
jgi:Uma2 family endonuclease